MTEHALGGEFRSTDVLKGLARATLRCQDARVIRGWIVGLALHATGCSLNRNGLGLGAVGLDADTETSVNDTSRSDDTLEVLDTSVVDTGSTPDTGPFPDTRPDTIPLVDTTPDSPPPLPPFITMTSTVLASDAAVNLTAEGVAGWAYWGLTDANSFARKAGSSSISKGSTFPIAGIAKRGTFKMRFSWSDGDPVGVAADVGYGIFVEAKDQGFSFDAVAGQDERTLRVYLEWYGEGVIIASLSDKSVPDQVLGIPTPATTAVTSTPIVYTVKYRSTATTANLSILVLKTKADGGAALSLHAASLQ